MSWEPDNGPFSDDGYEPWDAETTAAAIDRVGDVCVLTADGTTPLDAVEHVYASPHSFAIRQFMADVTALYDEYQVVRRLAE